MIAVLDARGSLRSEAKIVFPADQARPEALCPKDEVIPCYVFGNSLFRISLNPSYPLENELSRPEF